MKDPVYNSKPRSLDDFKMAIATQFDGNNSNKELCARVCESVISCMTKCIEQNGWPFEHLLQSFIRVVVNSINLLNE